MRKAKPKVKEIDRLIEMLKQQHKVLHDAVTDANTDIASAIAARQKMETKRGYLANALSNLSAYSKEV